MVQDIDSAFSTRDLFGGAIVSSIPTAFLDASDARPVPSTQEVFTSAVKESPISLIFDILEAQSGTPAEVVRTHFEDVAEGGWEFVGDVRVDKALEGSKEVFVVRGRCPAARGGVGTVEIFMGVVRLENVETDLVVTVNIPVGTGGDDSRVLEEGKEVFMRALDGLRVLDWQLFG